MYHFRKLYSVSYKIRYMGIKIQRDLVILLYIYKHNGDGTSKDYYSDKVQHKILARLLGLEENIQRWYSILQRTYFILNRRPIDQAIEVFN